MTAARETSVRRQVIAYLHSVGPDVCWRSNPATPYGVAGDPDLLLSVRGQCLAIELKKPGWRPTDAWQQTPQARRLEAWARSGAIACVVTSKAQMQQIVEAVLNGTRKE